jgi:excisionase family DNA binding protein
LLIYDTFAVEVSFMKKIYTPEEIADELSVSRKSVYLWLQKGELIGFKAGKLWRVTREDLEAFLGRSIPWEDN